MKIILVFILSVAGAAPEPIPAPVANADPTFIKKVVVAQPYPVYYSHYPAYPRHFWKRSVEANPEADPTFIKKVVVAQPYPVYYSHYTAYPRRYWKRSA